jgi:hypothetical protein
MQSQAHTGSQSRLRPLLASILVACCVVFGWVVVQAYRSYSIVASADIRDTDWRLMTQDHMRMAGFWTGAVAVCSFFAGASVVMIHWALRRREPATHSVANSQSLNCRSFLLCGVGISLVTAAYGGLCCYVGYYTISDALDFRALELGHLVLGYAAVNLALWIFALRYRKGVSHSMVRYFICELTARVGWV